MIEKILLYCVIFMVIFCFIYYFIIILLGRKKNISSSNGFDTTKDMISEYERINIIEGNNRFSYYNLKRKVIRLSKSNYYSSSLSDIALSLNEGALSIVDSNGYKYLDIFRMIFSNLNVLKLSGIVLIIVNMITYTVSDAKVGIILVGLLEVILYLYNDILDRSLDIIKDKISKIKSVNKENRIKVVDFNYKLNFLNKVIFVLGLVSIIRFVTIMLEFN